MKSTHTKIIFASFCFLFFQIQINAQQVSFPSNCIASNNIIQIKQADNSILSIVGKGNMNQSWTETTDGYSIVEKNGIYEYAEKQNGQLVGTGIKAHNVGQRSAAELNELSNIQKSLKPAAVPLKGSVLSQVRKLIKNKSFPTTGNIRVLALLIDFPDLSNTYSSSSLDSLLNHKGHRNGGHSFVSFYDSSSNGQLKITVDVYGWYRASNNYKYYSDSAGSNRSQVLVREAVDAAETAGVNFSNYDNDSDGYVDGIMAIHAGPGAEEGSQRKYIWSHRWVMGPQSAYYDGKIIDDYMINPETRKGILKKLVGIGVFCHEFGHNLGLPDLYDTDKSNGESQGIGEWGLMGSGSWLGGEHYPCNLSAWCRLELGWEVAKTIKIGDSGFYKLRVSSLKNEIFRINHTSQFSEYFLLENRQKLSLDTAMRGTGMAIWHINTVKTSGRYGVNADESDKGVDLEEADGKDDLDSAFNRGDDSDLYPGKSLNTQFNDNSTPNAKMYGNNSGLLISNIKELNEIIYFTLGNITEQMLFPQDTIVLAATNNSKDSLKILSNANWKLDNSASWLQIGKMMDSSDAEVPISTIQTNIGSPRYTIIYLRNELNELFDSVVVKQMDMSNYLLTDKNELFFKEKNNKADTIQLLSNLSWSITSNSNWFNFSPSSGSGNAQIIINSNDNSSFNRRIDSLIITSGNASVSDRIVKISQAGNLYISPKYLLLDSTKGSFAEFKVSSLEDTILFSSSQPWLDINSSILSGNPDSFLVRLEANTSNSLPTNRNAYIIAYNSVQEDTVWVEQKTSKPYFEASSDTVYLDKNQGSIAYFDVLSNVAWNITENANWLICNPISGSNHSIIELKTSTKNNSGNTRSTVIKVKSANFSDIEIMVIQKASDPLLSISKDSILLGSDSGDVQSFSISSNLENWKLITKSNWFKVSPSNGSFTQMIEVIATESNKSGNYKVDSIEILAAPFTPIVMKVRQDSLFSVGIPNHTFENSIQIFPNPSHGLLNINLEKSNESKQKFQLSIFNSLGEVVMQSILTQSNNSLNLSKLGKGIYIIRIQNGSHQVVKKISLLD